MSSTDNNNKPSILKSTREAKGLTIEIVHEATKIPMDALKAIEEGYSVRLLSPFYYKGFIKIYSEFLGLDVAEMYKHYGIDQPAAKAATVGPSTSKPAIRKEAQPNPLWENLQEGIAFFFKPKTLALILKVAGFLLLFLLLFKMAGCVAAHLHHRTGISKKQSSSFNQEKAPVPAVQTVKHEVVQAQSEDDKVELAVRADRNTWIQVKTDGKVVFQMTLSKGSMESWTADDRIELSGRDLEQLDMEVNNKQIGYLGGGERRIKKVVITHEGLTVKK